MVEHFEKSLYVTSDSFKLQHLDENDEIQTVYGDSYELKDYMKNIELSEDMLDTPFYHELGRHDLNTICLDFIVDGNSDNLEATIETKKPIIQPSLIQMNLLINLGLN